MDRKGFITLDRSCFTNTLGLLLGAVLAIAVPAQAADKPNVILIITDDMGWGDPGSYGFDRGIKAPVLSFVSSEEAWLVMAIRQEGSQFVRPGQELEFALTMYPGEIFTTTVGALVHGAGEAHLSLGGQIPPVSAIREIGYFAVRANLDETLLGRPMFFGCYVV